MTEFFKKYHERLKSICQEHHVVRLYAFGSVLTQDFNSESDIDLIVAFGDTGDQSRFKIYFRLLRKFEKLFDRKVDLLVEQPIRNPILREEIQKTKQLIYGTESQKMAV